MSGGSSLARSSNPSNDFCYNGDLDILEPYANNTNVENGRLSANRVANGDIPCIGKMKDLKADCVLLEGDFAVADYLPNRGSPSANWRQNDTVLRSVMRLNAPIRDVSVYPMNNAGFLGIERAVLSYHGWEYVYGWWIPPV